MTQSNGLGGQVGAGMPQPAHRHPQTRAAKEGGSRDEPARSTLAPLGAAPPSSTPPPGTATCLRQYGTVRRVAVGRWAGLPVSGIRPRARRGRHLVKHADLSGGGVGADGMLGLA
eukprot:2554567-Rhodomonas_salina.2